MASMRKMTSWHQWGVMLMLMTFLVVMVMELRYTWLTVTQAPETAILNADNNIRTHLRLQYYSDVEEIRAPYPERKAEDFTPFQIRKYTGDETHDKWIVLDVTSGECPNVTLSAPPGWRLVVVGDKLSTTQCRPPTCIIPQLQKNVTKYLTKDGLHLRRRNLAYLSAISRGAQQIMDADCRSLTPDALRDLAFKSTNARGLMYNATLHFNPYAHFGAWSAVPRALHDSSGVVSRNRRLYYVRDFSRVYVKHGLSEDSHDIVWLNTAQGKSTNCGFDQSAPPVHVGQRTFSPVVSSCAMYHQRALWGLLLPCTSDVLRCLVLRQYVLQRLLRELDAFSGFYQLLNPLGHAATGTVNSSCMHKGVNATSGLLDPSFSSTVDLDVVKLASILNSWLCKPKVTLFQCLATLFDSLHSEGFLKDVDVKLVKSWITSLQTLGVPEPSRVSTPWRGVRKITEVPVLLENSNAFLEHRGTAAEKALEKNLLDPVRTQCNGTAARAMFPSMVQWYRPVMTDIVLIIVFNENKYLWKNLPYMETIHRPFFKHIVYCTPNVTELMTDTEGKRRFDHVTFVEGFSDGWYLMYECLANVANMGIQGVRGYLHIGDDTLLNTWMLFNAPRDVMWLPRGFTSVAVDESKHPWGWYFWNKPQGRPAVLHTLSDLERLSGMTSEQIIKLDPKKRSPKSPKGRTFSEILFESDNSSSVRLFTTNSSARQIKLKQKWAGSLTEPTNQEAAQFLNNYIRVNRLLGHVDHRAIDLFYVPHVLREKYVTFARYFLRHGVIIELALPTLHFGLHERDEVSYVRASSLWDGKRNSTKTFYDKSIFFLHPFKMQGNMETEDGRTFFCDVYAQTLFSKLP